MAKSRRVRTGRRRAARDLSRRIAGDRPVRRGPGPAVRPPGAQRVTMDERLLFDAGPVAMVVCDAATLAILAATDHASVLYQYDRDALVRLTLLDLAGAGDRRALAEALSDVPAAERRVLRERRQCAKDG